MCVCAHVRVRVCVCARAQAHVWKGERKTITETWTQEGKEFGDTSGQEVASGTHSTSWDF